MWSIYITVILSTNFRLIYTAIFKTVKVAIAMWSKCIFQILICYHVAAQQLYASMTMNFINFILAAHIVRSPIEEFLFIKFELFVTKDLEHFVTFTCSFYQIQDSIQRILLMKAFGKEGFTHFHFESRSNFKHL